MQAQTITYIRSSRDPSKFYLVAENSRGFFECDCPAATFYRSRPCKHIEQVRRGCGLTAAPKRPTVSLTHAAPSTEMRNHLAMLEV